jgi:hypothetical protein
MIQFSPSAWVDICKRDRRHGIERRPKQYQTLGLASIHESATNPRRNFDESKLAKLAESLRTQGLQAASRHPSVTFLPAKAE